jgi:hypothetical protein
MSNEAEAYRSEAQRLLRLAHDLETEESRREQTEKESRRHRAAAALDDLPEGAVVVWRKRFEANAALEYTWAAVKTGDQWTHTGRANNRIRSSHALADFVDSQRAAGTDPLASALALSLGTAECRLLLP